MSGIAIDHQLLVEIGLGHLDLQQQQVVMRRIYAVVQLRVGHAVSSSLTAAQRDLFERVIRTEPAQAQAYLESTIPHYSLVVHSELDFVARSIMRSVERGTVLIDDPSSEEEHRA